MPHFFIDQNIYSLNTEELHKVILLSGGYCWNLLLILIQHIESQTNLVSLST